MEDSRVLSVSCGDDTQFAWLFEGKAHSGAVGACRNTGARICDLLARWRSGAVPGSIPVCYAGSGSCIGRE